MSGSPKVEAWVRGRFVVVPGARAERIRANAWTVRIPRSDAVAKCLRVRRVDMRSLEDLVLAIDEEEAEQCVVSAERPEAIEVSVLL